MSLVEVPTIRRQSALLAARFPAADPYDPDTDALTPFVLVAEQLVSSLTGRDVDAGVGEPVPPELTAVAILAVQLMTEQTVVSGGGDIETSEAAATGRRLRSISAGPWSESYFAPGEFARRGVAGRPTMVDEPLLDGALWALATPTAREQFIAYATGVQPPAAAISAIDYRKQGGGYSGRHRGIGGGFGRGPDGF